jgi:hypothetical protein
MRRGRKSSAQTKAPLKDRIKGSDVNKVGSASSVAKARSIVLSDEIISALKEKVYDFNEKNKNKKVSLNTLKAVFRRGAGAFSTSHRPNMTRNGWAYARVNKFLEKKAGKKVKKAYIQDDDLLEQGGEINKDITCVNCGWAWNTKDSDSSDMYVCHKCNFDNTLFYTNDIMKKGGKLKPAKSLVQIAKEKGVTMTYAFEQLKNGMKAESEHSDDKKIQKTIALQHLDENIDYYKKLAKMESTFAKGGEVDADNPKIKDEMIHKSGKVGGLLVGKRHSEGGIKAINKSNNSPLEMEGGEVVITRNAVSDDTKREFEGEMLTNREILSRINEGGGGVSFAKGGDVPEHIMVSGKEYKYGGKTLKDSEIVDYCGCNHKMAHGGDLKNFGVKHHDLKPSVAFKKIYGHKYKKGGSIESIFIIDKSVPSYTDFKNNNKNINLHTTKGEYKKYLKNNYKIDFDLLPHRIQMALYLGNQKLVDNYINS